MAADSTSAKQKLGKVVLAYSGGLDTCIIPWLKENYDCEVICFCANLGQADELSGLEEKAKASGASKCYCEDLREEFVTRFRLPDPPRRRDLRAELPARHRRWPAR